MSDCDESVSILIPLLISSSHHVSSPSHNAQIMGSLGSNSTSLFAHQDNHTLIRTPTRGPPACMMTSPDKRQSSLFSHLTKPIHVKIPWFVLLIANCGIVDILEFQVE